MPAAIPPGLSRVATDGTTVEGDGTKADPLVAPGGGGTVDTDGVDVAGDGSSGDKIRLIDTAVTPGTYMSANITVDQKGRITAASNGSGGGGSVPGSSEFGTGTDGSLTWDGTSTVLGISPSGSRYVLTRDVMATDMTVDTGVVVFTNGFRVFCTGTLTLTGTANINADGKHSGTAFTPNAYTATFYGPNGDSGSGAGNSAPDFSSSTNPPCWPSTAAAAHDTNGGGSGQGGGGGSISGHNAGSGGAISALIPNSGGYTIAAARSGYPDHVLGGNPFNYGSGGGGGAWDGGSGLGGAGGSGGWMCYVAAKTIAGGGTITAHGGAGTNGISDPGGGGGGGGGGIVVAIFSTATGTVAATATGGVGGSGIGVGSLDGGDGSDGSVFQVNLSGDGTHL